MGVSGAGKSTVGNLLSQELSIPFFDGDDFHPPENIAKMTNEIPLTDVDRKLWLSFLNQLARKEQKKGCIIACSALKEDYRTILTTGIENSSSWIFLNGTLDQIFKRLQKRRNHFMSPKLLQSQFDILEEPRRALSIDIDLDPDEIVKIVKDKMLNKSEFGLLGLGVMGKSLCRNLAQKGFQLSIYNRHVDNVEVDVAFSFKTLHQELENTQAFDDLKAFVNSIEQPRKIMLIVNVGKTTDSVMEDLLQYLSPEDAIIDGGNSHFEDTRTRSEYLKSRNIYFIGTGVSGGEEGALKGPSIMPGGDPKVYKIVQPYLDAIAAKDRDGMPCCTYIGKDGSGHFVKMVHNGIEYAEMQLLGEVVSVLKSQGKTYDEIAEVLDSWTSCNSYLLEITSAILRKKEGDDWLLDKILDKAGNKGTGNWTAVATAQLGVPSTLIASALFARYSSFYKEERKKAEAHYGEKREHEVSVSSDDLLNAYHFSRIINHYQGFKLLSEASRSYDWILNLSEIARIWTNGCIIRSGLMEELVQVLKEGDNLLFDKEIAEKLQDYKPSIKKVVSQCVLAEIAIPCLSEALNFFNGITTANSTANLIQAQRDFFGAHAYQRVDDPTEEFHHTKW